MRIRRPRHRPAALFTYLYLALVLVFPALLAAQEGVGMAAAPDVLLSTEGQLGKRLTALPEPIVNGVLSHGAPSVGLLLNDGICTGTLIGCHTFLTAAHCICTEQDGTVVTGAQCNDRSDLLDPANKFVFLQHLGFAQVEKVTVHPNYVPFTSQGAGHDLAILELANEVPGIFPSTINQTQRPPHGVEGVIVGFGNSDGGFPDTGLKRAGVIETAACQGVNQDVHVCWDFNEPLGAPGTNSNTCQGDSGGPLFITLGSGPRVAGVTSFGSASCRPDDNAKDADVFVDRAWIQSTAGADLHRSNCGPLPFAGSPDAPFLGGVAELSNANPEEHFTFEVAPGVVLVAVTLNGTSELLDADLYLRRGQVATTEVHDFASENAISVEAIVVPNPEPGSWHILASRFGGAGVAQVTVTLFMQSEGDSDPPPPPGPWLSSAALPGFEAKVLINDNTLGSREPDCISETLCVSGALAGRPEIFVKVIGPRPNGFLWSQLSRFTPSKVEVWLRQISTGQINYYELGAVGPAEDNVSGLQDREAFSP